MNSGPADPGARDFRVFYSTGQPAQINRGATNSFGLRGEGRLLVDGDHLTFEGDQTSLKALRGAPKFARADVANVDYNAENGVFLIRTRKSDDFVIIWTTSRADAEAIWALLPHEKTPEFLAEQAHHQRYAQTMSDIGGRAPVTPTIIALNVAMFIVTLIGGADFVRPDGELLVRFGSNYGPMTWTGEEWRLLSSTFLHFGIVHIALNMYALYQGGALVERLYGSARFALVYLLSALAGSVASGWWDPTRNSVGASGAIFGVYGAMLAFFALRRADFPQQLWKGIGTSALVFCAYSLAIGAAHPAIDNSAHVGGLLGGLVSGLLLTRPFDASARKSPQPTRLVLAALAVLLPLAWFAHPLISADQGPASGLRFQRAVEIFAPVDAQLLARQRQLMTPAPNVRINRIELAAQLNTEVLTPWRAAAQKVLGLPAPPDAASREARMQAAFRGYLAARDKALALRVLALENGEPGTAEEAILAERQVSAAIDSFKRIADEGT